MHQSIDSARSAQRPQAPQTPAAVYLLGVLRIAPILGMAVLAARDQTARSVAAVLLTGCLELLLIAGLARTWRRFYLAGFPLFLLGLLYSAYSAMYGTPPGRSLAFILLTTSPEEVIGYVGIGQARIPELVLVIAVAIYLYLSWLLPGATRIGRGGKSRPRMLAIACLLPVAAYAASDADQLIDGAAYEPTVGSVIFFAGTVPRADAVLHGAQVAKTPFHAYRSGGEEVHVLVVGESARRDSWSAYGYSRPTTPYLDSIKQQLILLRDAVADANLTSWAVPILLTGMTPEQVAHETIHGNIVDLAKEAGYTTTWLLNQDITISVGIGIAPDRMVYPADWKSNILDRHTLDEELLPAYRRELDRTGQARFIGIHMMGSHWEYYRRYPPAFRRFGSGNSLTTLSIFLPGKSVQAEVRDCYDNTVLYTDWFLQQVIEPARRLSVPATVTFFPDHGEDLQILDGESGHGAPQYTAHAFSIPAFVWVNEAYRKAHPDRVAALEKNAWKEVRTHNLFSTLADLMGITWPGRIASRSFASEQFVPDTGMKLAAGGVLLTRPEQSARGF
jgi:glucan phosphoethanolaminetransferase (alkaline phosphatase superfamily)